MNRLELDNGETTYVLAVNAHIAVKTTQQRVAKQRAVAETEMKPLPTNVPHETSRAPGQ